MWTGGKQWSAALVACAGDQWSLIFPERLRLHFLGGRRIADPSTGRVSGSNKQGFLCLDTTAVLVCLSSYKQDGVQIIKQQLTHMNHGLFFFLLCDSVVKYFMS